MKNLNLTEVLNSYKNGKLGKSSTLRLLRSILEKERPSVLYTSSFQTLIESEQSIIFLLKIYLLLKSIKLTNVEFLLRIMEDTIGKNYIIKYGVIPSEAMALGFFEMNIGQELINEVDYPEVHHIHTVFKVREGHVIELSINEVCLNKITFLELFPYLEYLRITVAGLTELRGIEGLVNLKYLDLHGNNIRELPNLGNLKNLKELYIDSNPLTNVRGINKLKQLRKFDLTETELPKKKFEKIYESVPYNWLVKGITQFNDHNYSKAIKCFKKAISLNPHYSEALYYLGIVYKKKDKLTKASKSYYRAVKNLANSDIIYLPTNIVFEDYKDNLITKESALKIFQSLIENSEYEHIQIDSIKYYDKLKLESD